MHSDNVQSDVLWRTLAWAEHNKKQVILGAVAAILIGLIIYFIVWQRAEKQVEASRALSTAFAAQMDERQGADNPDAYLKVAKEFPNSKAAARASLFAATALFTEGKYDQALGEFQKFVRENQGNQFVAQGMLGIASTLEAQGKTDQALESYSTVVERYPNNPVLPQAKFGLARLRQAKGDLERALVLYEDIGRDQAGSLSNEAGMRAEEIKQKHPELAAKLKPQGPVLSATTNQAPAPGVKIPAPAPGVKK